jgi:uncharacterized membrane protein
MNRSAPEATAPRSVSQYLQQLRQQLAGEDAALIQDAVYDAEEYLRAEIASHPDKSEADVLELIASTYGAPDEVAAAYRSSEATVKAAMASPVRAPSPAVGGTFFGIFLDFRAYTSLLFMMLSLVTGILYFVFAVVGTALSAGLSVLIIGVPFFLLFMGIARVISLGEGRLLEAITGERMPRRPLRSEPSLGFWAGILDMLKDRRTWSTLAYLVLMLPLGVAYFTMAITGLSLSLACISSPVFGLGHELGWIPESIGYQPHWLGSAWAMPFMVLIGVLLFTLLMHLARGVGRLHALFAKTLLVARP